MTSAIAPAHDCVIVDASCVISLYASSRMEDILVAVSQSVAVATHVRDVEALRIGGRIASGVREPDERIDLQPFIDAGLLIVVQPESESENIAYVNFAASVADGEAVTGAIAVHRHWAIGIDDLDARKLFAREAPQLQLISTPEFVKHWVDNAQPSPDVVRAALQDVRVRGRYVPGVRHPLHGWWMALENR